MAQADNPLDDLPTQIMGRLQTLEVLMVLMLRGHPQAEAILATASEALDQIEAGSLHGASVDQEDGILRRMNVARYSLDAIAAHARPRGQ